MTSTFDWKKWFQFWVWGSLGGASQVGRGWPTLPGLRRQCNEPMFSLMLFWETRLSSKSLEPLIDFLAYLQPKLWITNQKVVRIAHPQMAK